MNNFKTREVLPYMKHGRWYKFFIESTEDGYVITTKDLDVEIDGLYMKLPAHYHIIDEKYDIENVTDAAGTLTMQLKGYEGDIQAIRLPAAGTFDDITIYIFANLED